MLHFNIVYIDKLILFSKLIFAIFNLNTFLSCHDFGRFVGRASVLQFVVFDGRVGFIISILN